MCIAYFGLGEYDRIPALINRTRLQVVMFQQYDVLAKLCWLDGDLAFVDADYVTGFGHYHQACAWAIQYTDALLQATMERIKMWLDIFLETGQNDQAVCFCQVLQHKPEDVTLKAWQPVQIYFSQLELAQTNEEIPTDSVVR